MNERVILIAVSQSGNGLSKTISKSEKTVFCRERTVGQREFFEAMGRGLKAEYMLEVWTQDYSGESVAKYNGKEYKIYRTYKRNDITEIYLASEG